MADKKRKVLSTQKYEGYVLQMLDNWRIRVPGIFDEGTDYNPDNLFDTLAEAKEGVRQDIKHREQMAKRPLDLKFRNDENVIVTVRGIHARQHTLLSDVRTSNHELLYPADVEWISQAIAEMNRLRHEANRIETAIKPYGIEPPSGYDERKNKAPHHERVDRLEARYKAVEAAAKKTTFVDALAKVSMVNPSERPKRKIRL